MRASFWVLGPLLARCGQAKVSLPGGCAIGTRPVDLHLMGLKELGAEIEIEAGYVIAKAKGGYLRGGRVVFPKVSVGATHNVLLASALARGETVIENAAREPEIGDVAECLVKMGAKIEGIGTSTLRIQGADRLEGAVHSVLADRIETGTFAMAVAAVGGDVLLEGARPELLKTALDALAQDRRHGPDHQQRHPRLAQRPRHRAGHGRDAAVPRLPDRSAGAAHGADDDGQGHQRHPRDDLREPLHARAGAGASRRRHHSCTATRRPSRASRA